VVYGTLPFAGKLLPPLGEEMPKLWAAEASPGAAIPELKTTTAVINQRRTTYWTLDM
jgi:hypothetical protein